MACVPVRGVGALGFAQTNPAVRGQLWRGLDGLQPRGPQLSKHVRLACHYVRELADEKVIAPQRVPSADNLADFFTKAVAGPTFKAFVTRFVSEARR